MNVFVFCFNVAGSNLRHSHIGIQYWKWLEYLIISPAQHQLHHSVDSRHYDKNFGATLAIWDWFFGSLNHSEDTDLLTLGVKESDISEPHSLHNLYIKPIADIFKIMSENINSIKVVFRLKKN